MSFINQVNVFRRNISHLWWIPMITGLISLGLGIWTLCSPSSSIGFLAYVFAAALCVAGFFNLLFAGTASGSYSGWGWPLVIGIIDLICGIWLFAMPAQEMIQTFVWVVGIWIMVEAFSELFHSFMLIRTSPWWILWMILLLIATIVIGFTFLTNPIEGGVIVWLWLALSLILFGLYRISFAARLATLK